MSFTMERWHSAVGQRFAVRKYREEPAREEIETLRTQADTLSARGVPIVLAQIRGRFRPYCSARGRVKGTGMVRGVYKYRRATQEPSDTSARRLCSNAPQWALAHAGWGMFQQKACFAAAGGEGGRNASLHHAIGIAGGTLCGRGRGSRSTS
jgi:hypothetical protein